MFWTCHKVHHRFSIPPIQGSQIERLVGITSDALAGRVKIALPEAFAEHLILPAMSSFRSKYPSIELEFLVGNELVDMTRAEADIAVRFIRPIQGDLIVRRIGRIGLGIFGTPEQINRPLDAYNWVCWPKFERWIEDEFESPNICLRTDRVSVILAALTNNIGVSWIAASLAKNLGLVEKMHPVTEAPATEVFLVTHSADQHNRRIEIVRDFLIESCHLGFN